MLLFEGHEVLCGFREGLLARRGRGEVDVVWEEGPFWIEDLVLEGVRVVVDGREE